MRVWRERLARWSVELSDSRVVRLITFVVGPERFVFDIMTVRQIIPYTTTTKVPQAPEFIEGIIVLRNEVIPIVDLRARLFPRHEGTTDSPLVLICDTSYGTIGLKVDQVLRILPVETDQVLPAPRLIRGLKGDLFFGIINTEKHVLLVLDLESLLSSEEQEALAAAELQHAAPAAATPQSED